MAAESTAASTENARLMIRGEMELGLACMGTLKDLKDAGMDVDQVRLIAVGHTSDTHWIVRKESPIQSVYDFKGKVIGVGPAGSATLNIYSKKHLAAGWNLTFDDFSPTSQFHLPINRDTPIINKTFCLPSRFRQS